RRLALTIALRPTDSVALSAFATAVSTPGTPQYGHYLSVSQFAQRFGATSAQIAAVSRTLRAAGLSVGAATANHLSIPVTGTAAQVQKAFSVSESQVTLAGGRVAFANDRAPLLTSSIAHVVQGVIGLDNLSVPRPQGLSRAHALRLGHARPHIPTGGPQPCASATSTAAAASPGAYTADLVATAYQFSPLYQAGNLGQGQTVAVFEQQPYDPADIGQYQGCYQTSATVTPVTVGVGPGADIPGVTDDGEAALDIEQIVGLAPKASVLVYQGAPTSQGTVAIMNQMASDNKAKVISSSWGECESGSGASVIGADDTALKEMAAQGQSFFISSGDSGSEMCSQLGGGDNSLSVITPGSDPFATGVGGSTLWDGVSRVYSGGTAVEGVWNDSTSTNGATGGGISTAFAMPAYQSTANAGLGVVDPHNSGAQCGSTTPCREVPDVSANADPKTGYVVYVTGTGGQSWTSIGGTSAAAPLWAAFTALVNDNAACRGQTIGFANPSLYAIAGSAYTSNFRDVATASPISGDASNDYTGTNSGEYPVKAGYDLATGLGSPLGSALAGSLCALRSPVYSVSVASPGNQLTVRGTAVSVAVHGADSGGVGISYAASGLPAGLSINPSTGVISGTATTQQTATVTVSASDAFTNAGSTAFTWSVVVPTKPREKAAKFTGLGKGKPKLTFSVNAGQFAPALKSVQIKLPGGLSFARKAKSLAKGITVKSGSRKMKFAAKVKGGGLLITFKSAVTSASVTLVGPTITISRSEASKIRRHKVKKLTISLKTTDASNKTTSFSVAFKKPK
ncbi:MAG: protease pro-enzyme activation domain-containing protein, partial [Solirubrobacteraceae bacterium]